MEKILFDDFIKKQLEENLINLIKDSKSDENKKSYNSEEILNILRNGESPEAYRSDTSITDSFASDDLNVNYDEE